MQRAFLICGCAALALAACSKKADTGAAPAASASAPVATAAPAAPPTRKGGLWEQAMNMGEMKQTISMCVDETSEAKTKWWSTERHGTGKSNCAEQTVTPTPGGWAFHSVCSTADGGKVTSDGTATGDFGSHYKVEMTAVTSGSSMAQANGTHKMSMEGTWKGPCPAGMKPGDMEMPGGMKFNATDGGVTTTSIVKRYDANHPPSQADIAKMRAQAMDMAKAMKAQQGEAK